MARVRDPPPANDADAQNHEHVQVNSTPSPLPRNSSSNRPMGIYQHFAQYSDGPRETHQNGYDNAELDAAQTLVGFNTSSASQSYMSESTSATPSANTTPTAPSTKAQANASESSRSKKRRSIPPAASRVGRPPKRNRGSFAKASPPLGHAYAEEHKMVVDIVGDEREVKHSARVNSVRRDGKEPEEQIPVAGPSIQPLPKAQSPKPHVQVRGQAEVKAQKDHNETGGPANPESEAALHATEKRKSAPRNFDKVLFGHWLIKTWYHSPYPLPGIEEEDASSSASAGPGKQNGTTSASRGHASKRGNARGRPRAHDANAPVEESTSTLWVCDRCFKYMRDGTLHDLHSKFCNRTYPPGKKVYQRGAHVIYEIDGAKDKLFCQNLSLFGKLFLDTKTLFFDCENFMFYVLCEGQGPQDHVMGFFSKEKISYDDYNLACIIVFPPYQRKRYGMLMIEFSYYLSRKAGKFGTPERPLSDLGLRSYLTYWITALVQFFRRVLSVQPGTDIPGNHQHPISDDLVRIVDANQSNGIKKRKKSGKFTTENAIKIWEGSAESKYNDRDAIAATSGNGDILYSQRRWMRTSANPDGSATTHVFARSTLEEMSLATGIRTEDIAFTLNECGLLQKTQATDVDQNAVVISRQMVEHAAVEFRVKIMCMQVEYCIV